MYIIFVFYGICLLRICVVHFNMFKMTPERRREMASYRELAKGVEARLHRWGRRQCNTKRSSIDSGVTFSSSDQTPNENLEQHQGSPWGESSENPLNATPDKNRVNLVGKS